MKNVLKRYWRTSLLAILLVFLSYFFSNLSFSFSNEGDVLRWIRIAQHVFLHNDTSEIPDSILLINVSNDRQLVDAKDEYGLKLGNKDITDRHKLLRLLKWLNDSACYNYILMDITFDKGYNTVYDDSLFLMISSMKNIVVAKHEKGELADDRLKGKAYEVEYTTTILKSDLIKYPIITNDTASFPLHVFEERTNRHIKRFGWFYFDGWKLARRCIYPKMYITEGNHREVNNEDSLTKENQRYYNMGKHILEEFPSSVDARELFCNKIIVIGAFGDSPDRHTTYAGELSGALVNLNVYLSLSQNNHIVPPLLLLILFIVFFFISDHILYTQSDKSSITIGEAWLGWKKKAFGKGLLPLALLWAYYSVLLIIICVLTFIITGQAHDIFFTSTVLSFIDWIVRVIKNRKK